MSDSERLPNSSKLVADTRDTLQSVSHIESESAVNHTNVVSVFETYKPKELKKRWHSTLDSFRSMLHLGVGDKKEILKSLDREIADKEREGKFGTLSLERCQMDDLLAGYQNGMRTEVDAYSPYLADNNMATGEILRNNMLVSDQIGLEVARVCKQQMPESIIVSLADEFHTFMQDRYDSNDQPIRREYTKSQGVLHEEAKTLPMIHAEPEVRKKFRDSVAQQLIDEGIAKPDGSDVLVLSEFDKQKDVEEFVRRISEIAARPNAPFSIEQKGEKMTLVSPDAENPLFQEIVLRNEGGKWMCPALDAASFIHPRNKEIMHLVVLPDVMKDQQDQVWEMLRLMDIEPQNYHNIYYDSTATPDTVKKDLTELFEHFSQTNATGIHQEYDKAA